MGIGLDSTLQKENEGIVPRFITTLFNHLSNKKQQHPDQDQQVSVSFLELHNEDLIDLLLTSSSYTLKKENQPMVVIRQDNQGNICWSGIREEIVSTPQQLFSLLEKGSVSRFTAATDMNISSSRSHAIFSIQLKQTIIDDQGVKKTITSKFHFVDLAGSERLKRTNAVGDRAKEGISINSGLLALGNVISALADESKRASHIPYRDSKLTRLLQDSLGGNSQTLMLACISPSWTNHKETLNTLKYANRARNIRNRVVINQMMEGNNNEFSFMVGNNSNDYVKKLKNQIGKLRQEIAGNDEFLIAVNNEMDSLKIQVEGMNITIENLVKELGEVKYQRDCYQFQIESNHQQHYQCDQNNNNNNNNINNEISLPPSPPPALPNNHLAEEYAKTIEELKVQVNTLKLQKDQKINQQQQQYKKINYQQNNSNSNGGNNKQPYVKNISSSKDSAVDSLKTSDRKKKRHSIRVGSKRLSHQRSFNSLKRRQNNSGRTNNYVSNNNQYQQAGVKQKKQEWSLFVQQEKGKIENDLTFIKTLKTKILPNNSELVQNNFKELLQYSESLVHEPTVYYVSGTKNNIEAQNHPAINSNSNNSSNNCNFVELLQRFDECLNRQESMLQNIPQLYPAPTKQQLNKNNDNNNNNNNVNNLKRQHEKEIAEIKKQYEIQQRKQQHEHQAMKRQYQQLVISSEKARNQHNSTLLSMKQKIENLTKEKKKLIKKSKQDADKARDRIRQTERQIQKLERQEIKSNQLKKKLEQELHSQKQMNKHAKEDIVHLGTQLSSVAILIQKVLQSNNSNNHQSHFANTLNKKKKLSSKMLTSDDCTLLTKAIANSKVRGHLAIQKHGISNRRNKSMKVASLQKRFSQKKQLIQKAIDLYVQASISMQLYEQLIQKRDHLQLEQQNLLFEHDIIVNEPNDELQQETENRINQVAMEYHHVCEQIQQFQMNNGNNNKPHATTNNSESNDIHSSSSNSSSSDGEDDDHDNAWIDDAPFWDSEDSEIAYENLLTLLRTLEPDETRYILEIMVNEVIRLETKSQDQQREDSYMVNSTTYFLEKDVKDQDNNYITISSNNHQSHHEEDVITIEPVITSPNRKSSLPIPSQNICK
ncbi:unnamed protein product [Cunninghamella blakesleeana]